MTSPSWRANQKRLRNQRERIERLEAMISDCILLRGNPMEPNSTDVIAQFSRLPVGRPVPDGWRVLSGNTTESEIARVAFRFEIEEESGK
jgi:hypothetical protein